MVVDGLVLCNTACLTCLWCALLSMCFPKFMKNLQQSDSSACCAQKSTSGTKLSQMLDQCKSKVKLIARQSASVCKTSRSQLREMTKPSGKNRTKHKFARRDRGDRNDEGYSKGSSKKPKITVCVSNENNLRTVRKDVDDEYEAMKETPVRRHHRSPTSEKNRKYKLYAKLCRQPSGCDEQFMEKRYRHSGSEEQDLQQQCSEASRKNSPSSNSDRHRQRYSADDEEA